MTRPVSVLTGMFCKFGSELESLPVAVTFWLNVVCKRFVFVDISGKSPSKYVDFNFEKVLYSKILSIIGRSSLFKPYSTSTSVEYPLWFFFPRG